MRVEILCFGIAVALGWLIGLIAQSDRDAGGTKEGTSLVEKRPNNDSKEDSFPPAGGNDFASQAAFAVALHSAIAGQLESRLLELIDGSLGFNSAGWEQTEILMRQLAAKDPERALEFLNRNWNDSHGSLRNMRRIVIAEWARSDVPAAFAKALAIDPEGDILPLFEVLSLDKLEEIYELMIATGADKYMSNLFNFMALHPNADFESIASKAVDSEGYHDRGHLGILSKWSQADHQGVSEWIDSKPSHAIALWGALAKGLIQSDIIAGLDSGWSKLPEDHRASLLYEAGHSRAELDPDAFLAWIDANIDSPKLQADAIGTLAKKVASSGRPEAIAELVGRADGVTGALGSAVTESVEKWYNHDSSAALEWIDSIADPGLRSAAAIGAAQALLKEPKKAVQLLKEHLHFPEGDGSLSGHPAYNLTNQLVSEMGKNGMRAEEIAAAFPEQLHEQTISAWASIFSKRHPEQAIALIESRTLNGELPHSLKSALRSWHAKDASSAMAWIEQTESEPHRRLAITTMTDILAEEDPQQAAEWLNRQPNDTTKRNAIEEFIKVRTRTHPEAALEVARAIEDENARGAALTHVLTEMASTNPEAAFEAMNSVGLPSAGIDSITREADANRQIRRALLKEPNPARL